MRHTCSSNIPAFAMFVDVPVAKTRRVAKPRVNTGGGYIMGMGRRCDTLEVHSMWTFPLRYALQDMQL